MECLECRQFDTARPAVGVCAWCGTGACSEHGRHLTGERALPTGNGVQRRTLTRRAFACGWCSEHAAGTLPGARLTV